MHISTYCYFLIELLYSFLLLLLFIFNNNDMGHENGLIYKINKLCVSKGEFGFGKIVSNLQRYVYWPIMQDNVA
jgi:hypothetical protein